MSKYLRVIPRDLFNEASLLKCYGRLYILLDNRRDHRADLVHDDEAFDIIQRDDDGAITVRNVQLFIDSARVELWRPLNSRDAWPLYAEWQLDPDAEPVEVFTDDGDFTPDMLALIGAGESK